MDDSQLKKLTQVTSPTQQLVVEYEMSSAESEEVEESSDDESILRFHVTREGFAGRSCTPRNTGHRRRWPPINKQGSIFNYKYAKI